MIPRSAQKEVKKLAKKFPIVALVGPRQSGKTTLSRLTFPKYKYVSLEDLDQRRFAQQDPRGFLENYPGKTIIDEAQNCPDLFSYLQTHVDQSGKTGQYILTGSQNFLLQANLSQSLAGRVALITLLPLSLKEVENHQSLKANYSYYLSHGFYPRVYDKKISPLKWYANYLKTYVERDVRQLIAIKDLSTFQKFLKLCAGRVGQVLNLSSLASDAGVSHNTIKAWVSILEASFIAFTLPTYYKNFNKRLIKNPKFYFYDVGLASYLLGIKNVKQIDSHYAKGALFENLVLCELMKNSFNKAEECPLYYWRDRTGHEVDGLIDSSKGPVALEIKSGKTINESYFGSLKFLKKIGDFDEKRMYVIYGGKEDQKRSMGKVLSWRSLGKLATG